MSASPQNHAPHQSQNQIICISLDNRTIQTTFHWRGPTLPLMVLPKDPHHLWKWPSNDDMVYGGTKKTAVLFDVTMVFARVLKCLGTRATFSWVFNLVAIVVARIERCLLSHINLELKSSPGHSGACYGITWEPRVKVNPTERSVLHAVILLIWTMCMQSEPY